MIIEQLLERYHSLIDDPEAFQAYMSQPSPNCVWANSLKSTPQAVTQFLQSQNLSFEPLEWYPNAFRVHHWDKPGATLAFITGWYNLQEEISLSAVHTLDPQPGEQVLDLCAAPGGKTVQMAAKVGSTGKVVANEVQVPRLASLRAMLDRMGLTNVITTNYDGRKIPLPLHSFDRILVDAPCSGEGSLRQSRTIWKQKNPNYHLQIARTQRQLLDYALKLVKPGGVIVYSTCTFAPEENEAVIDQVLRDRGCLESANIPQLQSMSGLKQWHGTHFREDMVHAQRYFPHFNDTGGFFVARIRRSEAELDFSARKKKDNEHLQPKLLEDTQPLQWFCQHFGISFQDLSHYRLWVKGKDKIWIADANCEPIENVVAETVGMALMRTSYKPTTAALQRFGSQMTRNAIALEDLEAVQRFLLGDAQPLTASVEQGYVHVYYGCYQLGCGLYKKGYLRSQIPKGLRITVAHVDR